MKIFLDANILISVLNKEYPLFTYSSRILSLADSDRFQVYTSPLSLAIAFYFSTKKSGETLAKRKIKLLMEHLLVSNIDEMITRQALENPQVHDFEDGLQYYSALEVDCQVIISEDQADFYFSELEVMSCEAFINKYF